MARIKFRPGKFSRATAGGGFGGLDGLRKVCIRYRKGRCVKVAKKCPRGFRVKLRGRKKVCAPSRRKKSR